MAYPAESYQRMYDPNAGDLWTPEHGLALAEDGDHYSPERDFFEWWYFDAAFENGYRLVAILHSSLYNAVDHKPTIDLRVTPPGMSSQVAIGRYSRAEYQAAADHCDVQIASCRAYLDGPGRYRLRLEQGPISADLVFDALAPGWKPGTGYLFADRASGHYFKWVVPLPVAQVSGVMKVNGKSFEARGAGYHDHNWGNFVLADAFSHWYWGRFMAYDGEQAWGVVFGDVTGRGDEPVHVKPFLLTGEGNMFDENPNLTIQTHDLKRDPVTGVTYPNRLVLSAQAPGYRANLALQAGEVMEALDFAMPPFRRRLPRQLAEIAFYLSMDKPVLGQVTRRLLGKGSYLRLQAHTSLEVSAAHQVCLEGEAIYEIMQF
jgi:predicted secreted hydrolase